MHDRQSLTEMLRRGVYLVTFTKLDGEVRTMPCTLREDLLPPARQQDPISQEKVRTVSDQVMVVYCTDRQAFRSFRLANLISITEMVDQ